MAMRGRSRVAGDGPAKRSQACWLSVATGGGNCTFCDGAGIGTGIWAGIWTGTCAGVGFWICAGIWTGKGIVVCSCGCAGVMSCDDGCCGTG